MFIHSFFERVAESKGSSIALSMGEQKMTYSELEALSNQMANYLLANGVKTGEVVGLCVRRSPELIVSILGILKAGCAYLPLDPSYPEERLQYMVEHSRIGHLLLSTQTKNQFSSFAVRDHLLEDISLSLHSSDRPIIEDDKVDLAYVIYTSGSTGRPKGVSLGHSALINLIDWQNQQTALKDKSITLQFTPVSFDVHFQEIFSTLTLGGELVLITEDLRLDSLKLLKTISEKQINRIYLPFVAFNFLCETATTFNIYPQCLREVTTAGEQLKITESIRKFFKKIASAVLYNHYGPSETHVVTSHTLTGDPDRWPALSPIGQAIQNCELQILDDQKNVVPFGEEGELHIGGICLAKGYLNAPELTEEKFITLEGFGRLYRTGDLVRMNPSGELSFLGRKDGQVKISGHRVETNEIEVILQAQQGVDLGVVIVIEQEGEKTLCAYFCGSATVDHLKTSLGKLLPRHMMPRYFVKMIALPLTPSGKVNRMKLPAPSLDLTSQSQDFQGPQTPSERILSDIWKKHLKLKTVGIDDSFFDLGGNSLMAMRMMVDINHTFHGHFSVVQFFTYPTIKQFASFLDNGETESDEQKTRKIGKEDIAVIGMTGRFPGAQNVEELWQNLLTQKDCISTFTALEDSEEVSDDLRADPNFVRAQGLFPDQEYFDNRLFGMTPREAELMDPQHRKFLELSLEALELAGYAPEKVKAKIGVFAGSGNSKYGKLVEQYPDAVKQAGEFNVMLGLEKDYIATRVAHKLNLKGPALSIHTGCSTSLVAVIEAVKNLRLGYCDLALAGGISISASPNVGHLYQEGGILSQDSQCRPFDANASGTIFTEGGGVVVLKRLSDAVADQDHILAVIKGVGINNDGAEKMSFTAPSVQGQYDVIRMAHRDADIDSRSIGYIEAHGTATPVGDPIEVEALTKAFRKSTKDNGFCHLGSIKSNIGHLTAAAGIAGFIKSVLSVRKGIIPGTANFQKANPLLNLDSTPFLITSENQLFLSSEGPRRAAVSSFGVGGTNAHVVIEQYFSPAMSSKNDEEMNLKDREFSLFKISAKSESQLARMEERLIQQLTHAPSHLWRSIAYTLDAGRTEHVYRKVLVANKESLLRPLMAQYKFNGHKKLIFMLPGQGAHYSEMGKSLYHESPVYAAVFDQCNDILKTHLDYDLKEIIFDKNKVDLLNQTYYAQPAMFVIEYALVQTLITLGLKPDGYIGHSLGEYVAATLAGVFSLENGLKVIAKRAQLLQGLPSGSMLSVALNDEEVLKKASTFDLDLAAVNGPSSCVVAGTDESVLAFKTSLEEAGIAAMFLKTSHAFHSRMMSLVVDEFKEFLDSIPKGTPSLPIYSTVTSQLETDLLQDSRYWAEHIVRPVRFAPTVSALLSAEACTFLEVGPKNTLSTLAKKCASHLNHPIAAFQLLSSSAQEEIPYFMKALGELWCHDHRLANDELLYRPEERKRVPTVTYAFEKNRLWLKPLNSQVLHDVHHTEENIMAEGSKKTILSEKLIKIFESSSGIDVASFGKDMSFLEMGMDSLFLTQISLQIKKELKVNVTFRQLLEEFSTINLLVEGLVDQVELEVPSAPVVKREAIPQISMVPGVNLSASQNIERLIQQQLDLMTQQLQLLRGGVETAQIVQRPQKASGTRGSDIKKAKDSFGAAAKIHIEKSQKLTDEQSQMIGDFYKRYNQKTKKSKQFTQEHRKVHADPRVVTGFRPESKEIVYPIVVERSNGQKLWDIDGNEYIDMICGFGSNFFGNGNSKIKELVMRQLETGIEVGPQHPLVGEVSKLICELTGNERAAFCNTGSEAVLGAMRLARTVTGRDKIIVFSGSYHGINDEVIIRKSQAGESFPAAPGINHSAVSNIILLDYGTEESLEMIRTLSSEVAAVLVEPVQSRRCDFQPKEFLQEVRRITQATQTCLIFDEVITGFRIHPGGAQAHFDIRADLCTYGKIVGGGMPIGVISGRAEYMDALDGGHWKFGDDSAPTVGVTYFAGTFVRHPLALAAAKGALEIIRDGGKSLLSDLNQRAQKFADEINLFCQLTKVPLEMNNFGSLLKPKWTQDVSGGELLFALLRFNGVHVYEGFPWFVNLAHTDAELASVLAAFKNAVGTMQLMGLLPGTEPVLINHPRVFDPKKAPVEGALLGRDESGNPAWFIENPEQSGEYFLVEG